MGEFKQLGIPNDLDEWLEKVTNGNPSELLREDVLKMLGDAFNQKKAAWEKAENYLRDRQLYSTVFPEVKKVARERLRAIITERRRRGVKEKEDRTGIGDVGVNIVRIIKKGKRDTLWSIEIAGHGWIHDITTRTLLTMKSFKEVYFEAFSAIPDMPSKAWMWENYISQKTTDRSITEYVETDDEQFLIDEVAFAINQLNVSDSPSDLNHRKAFALPSGERCFTFNTIRAELFQRLGYHLKNQRISSILDTLGVVSKRPAIAGRKLRVYVYRYPLRTSRSDEEAEVVPLFGGDGDDQKP